MSELKNLFDKSIYKDTPKQVLSTKTPEMQDDKAAIADNNAVEQEPVDDEPPTPNFINLDLLVKPDR